MPIVKEIEKNGSRLNYHMLVGVLTRFVGGEVSSSARYMSWVSEEAHSLGVPGFGWAGEPVARNISLASVEDAEADLVTDSQELAGGQLVADLGGLDDLAIAKARKKRDINVEWNRRLNGGFNHAGHNWQTDLKSRTDISGTATSFIAGMEPPPGFYWTTTANVDVPMTKEEFLAFGIALMTFIMTLQGIARALKDGVDAVPEGGNALAEVAAIEWPADPVQTPEA